MSDVPPPVPAFPRRPPPGRGNTNNAAAPASSPTSSAATTATTAAASGNDTNNTNTRSNSPPPPTPAFPAAAMAAAAAAVAAQVQQQQQQQSSPPPSSPPVTCPPFPPSRSAPVAPNNNITPSSSSPAPNVSSPAAPPPTPPARAQPAPPPARTVPPSPSPSPASPAPPTTTNPANPAEQASPSPLPSSATTTGTDMPASAASPNASSTSAAGGTGGTAAAGAVTAAGVDEKSEKRARIRTKVVFEIESTERSYVESLETLVSLYLSPLKSAVTQGGEKDSILTEVEIKTLFSNIDVIAGLNRKFLSDLTTRLQGWDNNTTLIGDIFLGFTPFFKMYTSYCSNHDNATEMLKKLEKENKKFREGVLESNMGKAENKNLSLASYLIMPIQRIPRYKLLIEEVLRNTHESHPDYSSLVKGLELVSSVAKHVNTEMHAQENRAAILRLQKEFTHPVELVAPSRKFVKQGTLVKICRNSDKTYEFFLFNDMLCYAAKSIMASTSEKKYKMHQEIPIEKNFSINDVPTPQGTQGTEQEQFLFQINNKIKSFRVYTNDLSTKTSWLQAFVTVLAERDALEMTKEKEKGKAVGGGGGASKESGASNSNADLVSPPARKTETIAPVWKTDDSENSCPCCKKAFTFTKRRHHCRRCGGLCCNACSLKRMIIKSQNSSENRDPQRVCDTCVAQIQEQQRQAAEKAAQLARQAMGVPETPATATSPGGGTSTGSNNNTNVGFGPQNASLAAAAAAKAKQGSFINASSAASPPSSSSSTVSSTSSSSSSATSTTTTTITTVNENEGEEGESSDEEEDPNFPTTTAPHHPTPPQPTGNAAAPTRAPPTAPTPSRALPPPPSPVSPTASANSKVLVSVCRSLYAYTAASSEDLSLSANELIQILNKDASGWWKGMNSRGQQGTFPSNYVEEIAEKQEFIITPPAPAAANSTAAANPLPPVPPKPVFASLTTSSSNTTAAASTTTPASPSNTSSSKAVSSSPSSAAGNSSGGGGSCSECACTTFVANPFKPTICKDCRHNKNSHAS